MSSWPQPLAAYGPVSSAARAIKAANCKQALDPKPRAFSLAAQARGIALQNKSVQARQAMSRTQERMGDAAKLQHDILVTGRQRK